jgi:hypothetical protein
MIWKIFQLILEMKKQGIFDSNGEYERPDKEEAAIKYLEVSTNGLMLALIQKEFFNCFCFDSTVSLFHLMNFLT